MSRRRLMTGLLLAIFMFGLSASGAVLAKSTNFHAQLKSRNEVPSNDSNAAGQANFKLNKAGDALSFKLIVANIDDVTQAHIHCGGPEVNGPVVAFLFGFAADGATINGVLAEGVIEADDVIARPDSPACPGGVTNFDDLLAKMMSGDTYVNVHTIGFPGGEIRGQVR